MDDIAVKLRRILTEEMGIDPADIADDATLVNDLGLDSVEIVELAFLVENEFDIEAPDDSITANMTVGQVADAVRKLKGV